MQEYARSRKKQNGGGKWKVSLFLIQRWGRGGRELTEGVEMDDKEEEA